LQLSGRFTQLLVSALPLEFLGGDSSDSSLSARLVLDVGRTGKKEEKNKNLIFHPVL
jgi:hypothetical protein